jgi:Galactose oxidase, central domain
MAVVAVALLAASGCGAGGSRPGAAKSWRQLAAAPLSPRVGHSAVWTDGELLIWGGGPPSGRPKADGAAYDPAADRWRRLPPAPLTGRSWHAAVWTGTEMLVWGGTRPARGGRSEVALADGAAYRPATRTWRPIPRAPLAGDTAVWSGTELLAFGRAEGGSEPRLGGAAWDPRAGGWRRLATSPLPAGDEFSVVLAGGTLAAFTYVDSERACHGGLYDLAAGTWRTLRACPLLPIMYPQPIWTGSRIVLLTWGSEWFDGGEVDPWPERVYTNGIYDPASDTWTRPAARPPWLQPGYGGRFVWTGREVLLWGLGGGVAYDPSADRWRRMAEAPFTREFASYAWTGSELLVWGGTTGQDCVDGCPRADGLAYQPFSGSGGTRRP